MAYQITDTGSPACLVPVFSPRLSTPIHIIVLWNERFPSNIQVAVTLEVCSRGVALELAFSTFSVDEE
jgi:hypothetical protein